MNEVIFSMELIVTPRGLEADFKNRKINKKYLPAISRALEVAWLQTKNGIDNNVTHGLDGLNIPDVDEIEYGL